LDKESLRRILKGELNIRKVCAKIVTKLLSDKLKEFRMKMCLDHLQSIENEPYLWNSIISCEET